MKWIEFHIQLALCFLGVMFVVSCSKTDMILYDVVFLNDQGCELYEGVFLFPRALEGDYQKGKWILESKEIGDCSNSEASEFIRSFIDEIADKVEGSYYSGNLWVSFIDQGYRVRLGEVLYHDYGISINKSPSRTDGEYEWRYSTFGGGWSGGRVGFGVGKKR